MNHEIHITDERNAPAAAHKASIGENIAVQDKPGGNFFFRKE
jgi:hypothetical protein